MSITIFFVEFCFQNSFCFLKRRLLPVNRRHMSSIHLIKL